MMSEITEDNKLPTPVKDNNILLREILSINLLI